MQKKPLVSILIASFNKERLVSRCIQSCLKQTYKNIEIIFVDNESSDNSYKIAKKFNKIRVFQNNRKKFSKQKFNSFNQIDTYFFAYKKSKGKILCFLDSDDFFKKNKVEQVVNYFSNYQKRNIVFDKPIIYYNKNKNFVSEEFENINERIGLWPKFPPQSCISIRRVFIKKMINELIKKKFGMLTLDFRLATIAKIVYDQFFLMNKFLTFYFQDFQGESYSHFKKFGYNWWKRRLEAHYYLAYISSKYKKKINQGFDFHLTKLIVFILSMFSLN